MEELLSQPVIRLALAYAWQRGFEAGNSFATQCERYDPQWSTEICAPSVPANPYMLSSTQPIEE